MDIFFYDQKPERIKKVMPKLRLDHQFNAKIYVVENPQELFNKVSKANNPFLYFISAQLDVAERAILNLITSRIEDLKVCLLANEQYALMAWQYELFDFKKFPISLRDIQKAYSKYIRSLGLAKNYIPIKTTEGLFKIPVKDISFLEADGAYTHIHRITGEKKIVLSYNLKKIELLLTGNRSMKRIHKTYFINIVNIRSVSKNEVVFYGKGKTLTPLSRELGRRIRKEILK